jgi:hypothetical protein
VTDTDKCPNCGENHMDAFRADAPDVAVFTKAHEWMGEEASETNDLSKDSLYRFTESIITKNVDRIMLEMLTEDNGDVHRATVRFAALMMRAGYVNGVLTGDYYRTSREGAENWPRISCTEEEVQNWMDAELANHAGENGGQSIQEIIMGLLSDAGIDPGNVQIVNADEIASASGGEKPEEEMPPGLYL